MQTYRVAILGCRARGTRAALAYAAHPRTQVVALCDLMEERLAVLGDELGVAARFTDLDEMIDKTAPDVVVIATGTEYHYDLAMRVVGHGVHIDVEKPMCVDLVQADTLVAKAQETRVRVAVHHQGSVGAGARAVANAIDQGRIGDVNYLLGRGKCYYGGYGLLNIGTHLLNFMTTLAGPCRAVTAVATTGGRPATPEDVVPAPNGMGTIVGEHITATLELETGLTANLVHHRFPKVDSAGYRIEIQGTEGRIMCRSTKGWLLPTPHFLPDGERDCWEPLADVVPEHFDPQCGATVDDYWFADEYVCALDEGRNHRCSGDRALHVIEIMMGIFESAAHRRRVELPQPDRSHPLLRWREEHGLAAPTEYPRAYGPWLAVEDERIGG